MPAQEKLSVQTVNQHIVTKIFPQLSPAVRSKAPSKIDSHLLSKDVSCPSAHTASCFLEQRCGAGVHTKAQLNTTQWIFRQRVTRSPQHFPKIL